MWVERYWIVRKRRGHLTIVSWIRRAKRDSKEDECWDEWLEGVNQNFIRLSCNQR